MYQKMIVPINHENRNMKTEHKIFTSGFVEVAQFLNGMERGKAQHIVDAVIAYQQRGLRNRDVICKLQLQGIEIYFGTHSKLEAGKFNSTVDMIMALTQVFQCGYEELLREQK